MFFCTLLEEKGQSHVFKVKRIVARKEEKVYKKSKEGGGGDIGFLL